MPQYVIRSNSEKGWQYASAGELKRAKAAATRRYTVTPAQVLEVGIYHFASLKPNVEILARKIGTGKWENLK